MQACLIQFYCPKCHVHNAAASQLTPSSSEPRTYSCLCHAEFCLGKDSSLDLDPLGKCAFICLIPSEPPEITTSYFKKAGPME